MSGVSAAVIQDVTTRDANDNTLVPADKQSSVQPLGRHDNWRHGDAQPQPVITLTDMSESSSVAVVGGDRRHDQILYSEDFDVIQDYLQHTDSPMLNLSPSWLCHSAGPVFPSTPTIDMSSNIESSTLHAREVCLHCSVVA